ncbi:hypothetical protein [Catellatospora methionotrophica]|uniref:hypothetical protein n=1 Tax=Catellatospora methionotrophica TaxID=121620 RepID=UPI0033FD995A
MPLMHLRVLHNIDRRRTTSNDLKYAAGDRLAEVFDHHFSADDNTTAEHAAEWAFLTFSAPIERLEDHREQGSGEVAFVVGCLYRLLGLRSLYIGDVVEVRTGQDSTWLACDPKGWRRIGEPAVFDGEPLSADRIYRALASGRPE